MDQFKLGDKVVIIESEWNDNDTRKLIGKVGLVVVDYGDYFKVIVDDESVKCFTEELNLA
jgi:ribosomal protein L21E